MEKSIETIWNEGFLNSGELLVPKLNNLYNQKSNLVVEKFKKTYRVDSMLLIPFALLFAVGFGYFGHVDVGTYGMILILSLFFLNLKRLKALEVIDIKANSFEYLVSFRNGVKDNIRFYTRLMRIGVPIAILPSYWLFFRKMEKYHEFISTVNLLYVILAVIIICLILSVVGVLAVKLDTRIIYGKLIRKMDEMISEMEELRK